MSWIKKVLVLLIPLAVGFVSLEVGIRIVKHVQLDAAKVQMALYPKIYTDERDKDYLFWHKPNIDVKISDGIYDFTIKTNKLGHRSLSDEAEFERSIVFLGDSIIEGAGVENDETISHIVSQNTKVAAINLGVGSSNTVQAYLLGKDKILPEFNMKVLVFGFCLNDIAQNLFRRSFDPSIGNWRYYDSVIVDDKLTSHSFSSDAGPSSNSLSFSRRIKAVLRKSEAALFIYWILKNGLNFQTNSRTYNAEAWKNTEYFMRKMSKLADNHNAKLEVLIFPFQDQLEGKFDFNEQHKLKQILERNQINFFDPTSFLLDKKKSINDASNMFHDNTHPNKFGMSIIANSFSDYIIAKYFNDGDLSSYNSHRTLKKQ